MASALYTAFLHKAVKGDIDSDTDTFKMMLVTASYTYDADHDFRNDITNEVTGTGYTAGGATCTITPTNNTTSNRFELSISEPTWATATITARGAVVYKSRGGASSADELVCYLDFGADITSTAATFATDETQAFRITV